MEKMIAYCGLICTDCDGYLATQAGDMEELERLAVKAREEFNMPMITTESLLCDGCLATSDQLCGYCATCQVRACAMERMMVNCAHCDDYGCDTLEAFFGMAPKARESLDGIRAGLAA